MKKLRVAVLMGGKSPEFNVSLSTGLQVIKYLDKKKYTVIPILISSDGNKWEKLNANELKNLPINIGEKIPKVSKKHNPKLNIPALSPKPDIFFIAMHGTYGEDGTIQGLLEYLGAEYTGSGVLSSAICMNKNISKTILLKNNIPTPKYFLLQKGEKISLKNLKLVGLPCVVKPNSSGSSVGVSIVKEKSELERAIKKAFQFDKEVIIEEYIKGTEVSCGVLGTKNPFALPVIEICPKKEFFDYQAKYEEGVSEEIVPARIDKKTTKLVQDYAVNIFNILGCSAIARIDMIIRRGRPSVLEINTLPGLTPNSLLPKEAVASGIPYPRLLDLIIKYSKEKS